MNRFEFLINPLTLSEIVSYSIASRIPPGLRPRAYFVASQKPPEEVPEASWSGPGEVLEGPLGRFRDRKNTWNGSWPAKERF